MSTPEPCVVRLKALARVVDRDTLDHEAEARAQVNRGSRSGLCSGRPLRTPAVTV